VERGLEAPKQSLDRKRCCQVELGNKGKGLKDHRLEACATNPASPQPSRERESRQDGADDNFDFLISGKKIFKIKGLT
jgi:hypothetical protein